MLGMLGSVLRSRPAAQSAAQAASQQLVLGLRFAAAGRGGQQQLLIARSECVEDWALPAGDPSGARLSRTSHVVQVRRECITFEKESMASKGMQV